MNSKFVYIVLLILVFTSTCKKEELPEPQTGTPVFSVSTDNGLFEIAAGEDDFYMFTEFERDSLDVMSFIARFSKLENCEEACSEELIIEIRDYKLTNNNTEIEIDSALEIGEYPFFRDNTTTTGDAYIFNLMAEPEGNAPFTYEWNIGGTPYTEPNVSHTYEINNNLDSILICLSTIEANGADISDCDLVRITPNYLGICKADFIGSTIQGTGLIQLEAVDSTLSGATPYSYQWSTGELTNTINFLLDSMQNTYCLTVTDATGCADVICKQIIGVNPVGGLAIRSSKFSFDYTFQPGMPDDFQFGTVKIQYTDSEGQVYRSNLQDQAVGRNFKITAIEDYNNNEKGERTKKLEISGNCLLFAENGEFIEVPFNGVIGVAYP